MNLNTKVPCPNCGSKRNRQIQGHRLECLKCAAQHDGKANEHGVAVHHNPERNFELLNERKPR